LREAVLQATIELIITYLVLPRMKRGSNLRTERQNFTVLAQLERARTASAAS
jgi:hypothetical protein